MKKRELFFIAGLLILALVMWLMQRQPWNTPEIVPAKTQTEAVTEEITEESENDTETQSNAAESAQSEPETENTKSDLGSIRITIRGEELGTYPLNEDQIIKIHETNVCEIKNGQATMIDAKCPDQLCMYMAPINSRYGGLIVCLPNEVLIEGIRPAAATDDVDAIDAIG